MSVLTTIITLMIFVGALAWVFVMAYWILGRFGLWKWATYKRLKKRYHNSEFDNEIIEWCLCRFEKKWRFKDVRIVTKYEKNRGELLYTYLMLSKLPKYELKAMIERRSNNDKKR